MSRPQQSRWNARDNTSSVEVPANSWTPRASPPSLPASIPSWSPKSSTKSRAAKSSKPSCGVCRRPDCQLRSHKSYLSARQPRSQTSNQDLRLNNPGSAKPKQVDDLVIRTAFLKSYAYVEPSYLSVLQPSSFRLDVFHDLPVAGGDRPEVHKLVWNFLNNHLPLIIGNTIPHHTNIDEIKTACLTAAMCSPEVCLSILATEKQLEQQSPTLLHAVDLESSPPTWENYSSPTEQQTYFDCTNFQTLSNSITSVCMRLMAEWQHSPSPPASTYPHDHNLTHTPMHQPKLLTFEETVV